MSDYSYRGITSESHAEFKHEGSKFIAHLKPVHSKEEAVAFVKSEKERYSTATHVCSAYIIGLANEIQYFSDDGEPSNSAGRPILNALLSADLSYVVATVIRYYGGKKLGIPGLIKAYGTAVQQGIAKSNITELELKDRLTCTIAATHQHLWYNVLNKQHGVDGWHADGQFILECSKSLTSELRIELDKIPTLRWINL